jgi:hypothetical protein
VVFTGYIGLLVQLGICGLMAINTSIFCVFAINRKPGIQVVVEVDLLFPVGFTVTRITGKQRPKSSTWGRFAKSVEILVARHTGFLQSLEFKVFELL